MFASITDTINGLITRFAQALANGVSYCIEKVFQAFQWLGECLLSFVMGIFSYVLSKMPGFSSEEALQTAVLVRQEVAKWNQLFPVYETLICLNSLLTWKIFVMAKRRYFTSIQHAANLAELKGRYMPKK